ncbi:hypothetical protein ACJEIK_26300 [Mycobacterium sp. SMC-16]|uniref:hypothetical protein n=1 Tax=Mycobacterium sp. SMC-16 TaxID=3385967 RepID=UPI00390C6394
MPKYRTDTGVVVDVPEQKAERMGGLTPADARPASARRDRATKRGPGKDGGQTA